MVVSISLNDGVVGDLGEAPRDEAAQGVVVRVEVRAEELGDEVWFLMRGGAEVFGRRVDAGSGEAAVLLGEAVVAHAAGW